MPPGLDFDEAIGDCMSRLYNGVLSRRDFFRIGDWDEYDPGEEARALIQQGVDSLSDQDLARLNRLLIEALFPGPWRSQRERGGYLFETHASYWLNLLVDVEIGSCSENRPVSRDWKRDAPPPRGWLVHETPCPRPTAGGSGRHDVNDPGDLLRFRHSCFGVEPATPRFLSTGFHQVAPIVVQAGLMHPGELMAIENPEAHLHRGCPGPS